MVSVRFKDGVAEQNDQGMIEMLLAHPGFGADYISAEDTMGTDPYAYMREDSEPEHIVTRIEYGQPKGSGNAPKIKLTPEVRKAIQDEAMKMAKVMAAQMAPTFAAEYLKNALAERDAAKTAPVTTESLATNSAPKVGRPPKVKTE
jgi:hypothetical protein